MAGKLLSAITGLIIYCSSGQGFAFSFLPTTPRDDAVAVWLAARSLIVRQTASTSPYRVCKRPSPSSNRKPRIFECGVFGCWFKGQALHQTSFLCVKCQVNAIVNSKFTINIMDVNLNRTLTDD